MKHSIRIPIITLVSLLLFSCAEEKIEKTSLRPVKYTEVSTLGNERIRTFSGTAQTDKVINLSFRNSGIIVLFDLSLGQLVKKGQLLAKLDNVQSRLSYEQAVTDLNSAASQMNTSKLDLERTRTLYEKGSASLSEFEAAKNSFTTAKESYQSAKRGVGIQQDQVNNGYIYAPENGVIASISSEIDESVQSGQSVAVLNSGTDMEISLGIAESVINGISKGMKVNVSFTALPGEQFTGEVIEVSPTVDNNTATYPIVVGITENDNEKIKSGMAANVTFDLNVDTDKNKEQIPLIPSSAVGEDTEGQYVFLIEGEGDALIVKKHHITVGELSVDGFEVKSGLKIGQKIATAGLHTLLDGQQVKMSKL
ncbi:MAG: efflux RND transporter periplasmic adaptor subunit [Bacteroidota bacterium]